MHTDAQGVFHWSLEYPLPEQVSVKVYKRYGKGGPTRVSLEQHYTVPLSQLEREPIVLRVPK